MNGLAALKLEIGFWIEGGLLLAQQGIMAAAQELKRLPYLTGLTSEPKAQLQS